MRKKILAVMLAASMALTAPAVIPSATTIVAAEEATVAMSCSGWWTAHTLGTAVTATESTINFKSKTQSTAFDNWCTPVIVVYTGDEAKVNGAGYSEYAVIRSDAYAWAVNPDLGLDINSGAPDAWAAAGYSMETEGMPEDWATWLSTNKAGADCSVKAVLEGDKAVITLTNNGLTSVTKIPVDATKPVYFSISGEKCLVSELPAAIVAEENRYVAPVEDDTDKTEEVTEKKMTVKATAKAGAKEVTGTVSVKKAKVTVKVGKAKFKAAKVNGKKFTFATSELKKGTTVKVKVTKSGYKTVTKTVKVK